MTRQVLVSLTILSIIACENSDKQKVSQLSPVHLSSDSILIRPTIGINSISFYNKNDFISFRYKNLDFTIDSVQSVTDATDGAYFQNWIELINKTDGLVFTFSKPYNTNPPLTNDFPKTLKQIKVVNNKSAHFDNGITVAKSTYSDVVVAFGRLPIEWKNKRYIEYQDKGISFSFDTAQILQEVVLNKLGD